MSIKKWVLCLLLIATPSHAANNKAIWITNTELAALPTSGPAWVAMKAKADLANLGTATINDQNSNTNINVLAAALVFARLGDEQYRTKVRTKVMAVINTERIGPDSTTLAIGRELAAYVIAADLVGLESSEEVTFKQWLRYVLVQRWSASGPDDTSGTERASLKNTHRIRPNNWGTMAGATRAAIAVYLDSTAMLDEVATVFKGYLGDRSLHIFTDFDSDLSWHSDELLPVPINPINATKSGEIIDGVLSDDMQRGGAFQFPPIYTGYPWEALQGVITQAEILNRHGYPVYELSDQAIKRAAKFLYNLHARYPTTGWAASGDDRWQPWLINRVFGTTFATVNPAQPGKVMGWTDWTHPSCNCTCQ